MKTSALILLAAGCSLLATACSPSSYTGRYTTLANVALYPASRPVPDNYTVAIPVRESGCEPDASVARLLTRATGVYDALVQVTVQRVEVTRVATVGAHTGASTGTCWEVEGLAVFFGRVDPDAELRRRLSR